MEWDSAARVSATVRTLTNVRNGPSIFENLIFFVKTYLWTQQVCLVSSKLIPVMKMLIATTLLDRLSACVKSDMRALDYNARI